MMRHLRLVHIIVCVLCGVLAKAGATDFTILNRIDNPGFEAVAGDRPTSWSLGHSGFSLSNEQPHEGQFCLRFQAREPLGRDAVSSISLPLESNRRYEFEAWVRTRDLHGDRAGATIELDWASETGEWHGEFLADPIADTRGEWRRLRATTGRLPNARHFQFRCVVPKGTIGQVEWDDVAVRLVPTGIIGVTTNLYRNETTGGEVTVNVGIEAWGRYNLDPLDPEGLCVELIIQDEDESHNIKTIDLDPLVIGDWYTSATIHNAAITFDSTDLSPGSHKVLCRLLGTDDKLLDTESITIHRLESLPPRKSFIDPRGRLILDGQPIFPLGMYWLDVTEKDLDLYARSPFNCIMPYSAGVGRPQLDMAHARGVKVIYSLKDYFTDAAWPPPAMTEAIRSGVPDPERAALEKTVTELRDHPAIIAWYLNDEAPLTKIDRLVTHYEWVKALDPDRPAWVVLYQSQDLPEYLPTFDVFGVDYYPVPDQPAGMVWPVARKSMAGVFHSRPAWMVPQIMDWGIYRPNAVDKQRSPTLNEMRLMAWSHIAAGAAGLIFYSFHDLQKAAALPGRPSFDDRWRDCVAMGDEIKAFVPILLSDKTPAPPTSVNAPSEVGWRLFQKDGALYCLAVNSADRPATLSLQLAGCPWTKSSVILGLAEGITLSGQSLRLTLSPLEIKIIRLDRTEMALPPFNAKH